MKIIKILSCLLALSASCSTFAVPNLIVNGDFSLIHEASQGGKTNFGIPNSWSGISGQIDSATVKNGAMFFYTSGPRNVNYDKWYIFQSFDAANAGEYLLSFDYQMQNPSSGTGYGGATVLLDNIYSNVVTGAVPNIIFEKKYSTEYSDSLNGLSVANMWHVNETVLLNLTAGAHTLYLSAGGMDLSASSRSVSFDNISITAASDPMSAVPEPETYSLMLLGLGLIGAVSRSGKTKLTGSSTV